MFVNRN